MDAKPYAGVMLVTTTPRDGVSELDFNTWYNHTHLPEIQARVPGVESVERFRQQEPGQPVRYLAAYHISRPAAEILADMRAADLDDASPMLDLAGNPPVIASYDALA
ncbi:hypothetical protein [Microbacterium sp. P5_E9]